MFRPEMTLLQIVEDMIDKLLDLFAEDNPEEYEAFERIMKKR